MLANETTLLPVLMPLASAANLPFSMPQQIETILAAHGAPQAIIEGELWQMRKHRLAKTANRSVVGVMNEFARLPYIFRGDV